MSLSASKEAKIERIKCLAEDGATEGERNAARAALKRMGVDDGLDVADDLDIKSASEKMKEIVDMLEKFANDIEKLKYSFR